MRTRLVIELALAVGLSLRPAAAAAQRAPGEPVAQGAKCAALSGLQVPGFALAITRTDSVAAGPAARGRGATVNLPAHCRVEGLDRWIPTALRPSPSIASGRSRVMALASTGARP